MRSQAPRSISTNSRIKLSKHLDESSSLGKVNQSLLISSSNSLEKSSQKLLKFRLPKLPQGSSRGSNQETPISLEISEESIQLLKNSIQQEWENKCVPKDLQEIFSQKVWSLPRHKAIPIITRELDDIKHNRSLMISALRSVIAREESLASIHEMQTYLKEVPQWDKLKEVQLECAELLHAHRILTINSVESIVKWRDSISSSALINNEHSSVHIPFMHCGVNYLVKLRNDLDFLKDSEFNKVFAFENCDPLLIKPSKPIVKAKDKKIDSNYFIQHGKVVVSLPSSLRSKAEFAEEIIGKEVKMQNSLSPIQIEEISNVIYEELCEEEVGNNVKEFIGNNKPEVVNAVNEKILEDVVVEMCVEIAKEFKAEADRDGNRKLMPEVLEKILNTEIDRCLNELVKGEIKAMEKEKKDSFALEQRLREENANIARMIYNDLFGDVIGVMAEQMIEEITLVNQANEKKHQAAKLVKENQEIAEKIRNELIESYIKSLTLEIAQEVKQGQDNSKLVEMIYNDLLTQLIKDSAQATHSDLISQRDLKRNIYLTDLSEKIYENLIDSLILDLPNIASEAFQEAHEIYSDRSELLENMGLHFPTDSTFSEFSSLIFKKIEVPSSIIPQITEEYFPRIPGPELEVTAEQEKLEEETGKVESLWYWGFVGNIIVGLLVFSIDFDRNDIRVINIYHLTCLNWEFYSNYIEAACKFIWSSDNCQEIRVNLYVQGPTEIPPAVKKVFNTLKFRWKTNIVNEEDECSVIIMGKMRPQIKLKESPIKKKNLLPSKVK